mmetsp:Transcript_7825/g.23964  ORF Transcript_7825/g.23964 Transcript_7825/m.23964 type:complete len:257 (-) Transcript_7825:870-1640(-)
MMLSMACSTPLPDALSAFVGSRRKAHGTCTSTSRLTLLVISFSPAASPSLYDTSLRMRASNLSFCATMSDEPCSSVLSSEMVQPRAPVATCSVSTGSTRTPRNPKAPTKQRNVSSPSRSTRCASSTEYCEAGSAMYSASGLSLSTSGRTKLFSARICAVGAPVSPPPLGSARQHLAAPLLGRLLLPLLRLPLPSAAPRRPAAAAAPRRRRSGPCAYLPLGGRCARQHCRRASSRRVGCPQSGLRSATAAARASSQW